MRRTLLNSERLGWMALCLVVLSATSVRAATPTPPAPAAAAPDEPAQWLDRMNKALTSTNYDGTYSLWLGGKVELLRIIHRVKDGVISERLVSLDGSGREFIRTGGDLTCYLPDKRTVLVERRPAEESLFGNFPAINAQTVSSYDIREVARTRLNRRAMRVILVAPKDEYRYGYRLWIDESTAMPWKTQLCDAHGRVIEQTVFANLTPAAHIPDSAFKPDMSTEGFRWLRTETPGPPKEPVTSTLLFWSALKLPPGFKMTVHSAQVLPGSNDPVDHLVFTDGMASVSVFVEAHSADGAPSVNEDESATVGTSSAFSTVVDGHKVTAVGEVPPATVRFFADSVKRQGVTMSLSGPPRH
ncbi:MAG TPA: MucB/RseB C-terminal domain-containing protein [Steroidobacteraceae bacterium]|nr:MucB/RseB C-terminal domain-containing protein [Steroidobacteraceae bacterium]